MKTKKMNIEILKESFFFVCLLLVFFFCFFFGGGGGGSPTLLVALSLHVGDFYSADKLNFFRVARRVPDSLLPSSLFHLTSVSSVLTFIPSHSLVTAGQLELYIHNIPPGSPYKRI